MGKVSKVREILERFADQVKGHHCDNDELFGINQALTKLKELDLTEEEIAEVIYGLKNNHGELPPDISVAKAIHKAQKDKIGGHNG